MIPVNFTATMLVNSLFDDDATDDAVMKTGMEAAKIFRASVAQARTRYRRSK